MATTRGKGGGKGTGTPAAETAPPARRTRTRAPEDEISGVAAPEAAAPPAKRAPRAAPGAGVAQAPPAEAPRPGRRKAPGTGVASAASAPEAPVTHTKRGGKRETYAETVARRRKEKEVDQLQADLRAFAQARPGGWNHEEWVGFLADLSARGHDVSDSGGIGSRLEQERLSLVLGSVQGLGPKRAQALADRFRSLYALRHAGPDEIGAVAGMTRPLAQRVAEELRTRYP
jgi:hypothetical protein